MRADDLGLSDLADDHRGPGFGDGARDGERHRLEVDRLEGEAKQLRAPQAGGEQQSQNARKLGIRLGDREQARDLLGGEGSRLLVRYARWRGIGGRIVRNQPPFARLVERTVQQPVHVPHAPPRQRTGGRAVRSAAVRQQLGIERIEVPRAQLLKQDMTTVLRGQTGIALVASQRGRREVAALTMMR